jgi:hypothetical protein
MATNAVEEESGNCTSGLSLEVRHASVTAGNRHAHLVSARAHIMGTPIARAVLQLFLGDTHVG